MATQPTGTVTLLFTDLEGSTRVLERVGAAQYAEVLARHREILRNAFARHGGYEVDEEGDAFLIAFQAAGEAAAAAREAQQELVAIGWPEGIELLVRMGIHTGEPLPVPPKYVGLDVHRAARIMAAGHGGQVLVSETSAALLDGIPLRDLGRHRLKDLLEPIRIHQLELDGLKGEFPPLRSLHRTNLPLAAWPILGRERELDEIRAVIDGGTRLVTLTGPGGSGKTRLSLQAAAELSDEFPGGVFFAALAPVREVEAVLGAVAQSVGLQPDEDVVGWLRSRRALLILDNLEHLAGVDQVVSRLLVGETRVIATSRAPLHLVAEWEFAVEPLSDQAAVELFVSRAAAAGRRLNLDATVAEVCRRLDNLPLALELAAARVKVLSPHVLLQRLDAALPLLVARGSDRPERQRTLRATIEWSYDLLRPSAQAAFRRLSVFRGSFTLEAAEAIAGADVDELEALLDQSLLKPVGEERFFLLETLREYARERLDEAGETPEYALRHACWYLNRLNAIRPVLRGPRTSEFLSWYVAEEDNLRAMLDRLTTAAPADAACAADTLALFWQARGRLDDGCLRLEKLLKAELPPVWRAVVLSRLALFQSDLGQLDDANKAATQALNLAQVAGDAERAREALRQLSLIAHRVGDDDEAIRLGREVLELSGRDEHGRAVALSELGLILSLTRPNEARLALSEAADTFGRLGDTANESAAILNLSDLDLYARDFETMRARCAFARAKGQEIGFLPVEVTGAVNEGLALLALNRHSEARVALRYALDQALKAGMRPETWDALSRIALAADLADARVAAQVRGAVFAGRQRDQISQHRPYRELEQSLEEPFITALSKKTWAQENEVGGTLGLEDALALAEALTRTSSTQDD